MAADGEPPASELEHFIDTSLPLAPVPFVPEIRLHRAIATSGLHRLADADVRFGNPYWAYYWGGGLALARYVLDNREIVREQRILDLGTGSGLVAIAAALAGAAEVVAADVDPYAIAAAQLNAKTNGAAITLHIGDLTRDNAGPSFDVILVGDLFYDRATAARVIAFLRRGRSAGAVVLIGDPGRAFLPIEDLAPLATYHVSEASGAARPSAKRSSVFRLR